MRIRIESVSERYAAALESQQARRDYSAALAEFFDTCARAGSPQDYAVWSLSGYLDAAQRLTLSLSGGLAGGRS